jgi:hypothetical protein
MKLSIGRQFLFSLLFTSFIGSSIVYGFDRTSDECKKWVKAHELFCGVKEARAAEAVLQSIQYVDMQGFEQAIRRQIKMVLEEVGNQKAVVIFDANKSTDWILNTFLRLDLPPGSFDFADHKKLREYLTGHPEVTYFIRIDDAIYSGAQMNGFLQETQDLIKTLKSEKKLGDQPRHFYVASGYSTQIGNETISKKKWTEFHVHYFFDQLLRPLKDSLSSDIIPIVEAMYDGSGGTIRPLVFFEHKIPDSVSTYEEVMTGTVRCATGPSKKILRMINPVSQLDPVVLKFLPPEAVEALKLPLQFRCIPAIIPPYKKNVSLPYTYSDEVASQMGKLEEYLSDLQNALRN